MKKAYLALVFSVLVLACSIFAGTGQVNATNSGSLPHCPNGQNCGGYVVISFCNQDCVGAAWCNVIAYDAPTCYERTCGC